MSLTPDEEARLTRLRADYDRTTAGGQVTSVSSNGRTVQYAPGSAADMRREIEALEARRSGRRMRGAIGFRV